MNFDLKDPKTIAAIVISVIILIAVIVAAIVLIVKIVKKAKDKKDEDKKTEDKKTEDKKEGFSRTMLTNASVYKKHSGIQENYSEQKISNSDERIKKLLNRWA